ncbi:sugar-transfer associated ATP-grasp domain-containing protein [Methanolobus psychrotolerans]|uniref:sugar-transfer associated ATP-grasp domain-containing protein n=1 Tax=Methanolobus psychrotolerans TaxID=1874706 RepID=UPI0013EA7A60|nr:sugar-transfer associated ATP-grasp domain-containing protein [Methanolobus psychrotolerans]
MKNKIKSFLKMMIIMRGYSPYFASKVPKMFIKDLTSNNDIPLKQKIWAYQRGFLSSRTNTYRINELNYRNHMPDFDYYNLHPINGIYSEWIADKLKIKYILSSFDEYLPKYYFQLEDDEILRLMDCPSDIDSNMNGILELLKKEGNLALKSISGSLGEGFYKLSYIDDVFYINAKACDMNDVETLYYSLKGYLITEYINAHDSIRKIYDITPNTVRIQVIRDKNKEPKIIGSFIRFGTQQSGVLETPLAGGIIAGIDLKDGKTFDPNVVINHNLQSITLHPDTNENLEIIIPKWSEIKSKIEEISSYIPQLTYLGFDIIVTNEGFKIIEINSLTAPTVISYYYPLFAEEYSREYFIAKFQKRARHFKSILKRLSHDQINPR